jgi:hypothetical protein
MLSLPARFRWHMQCYVTKICQFDPKHLVETKLMGQHMFLKSWRFGGSWFFFSCLYFLSPLLEIHVRLAKNQGCPLIYFVFKLGSSLFWLVFLRFGLFLIFFSISSFYILFCFFLYQIWYSFLLLLFFLNVFSCFFLF